MEDVEFLINQHDVKQKKKKRHERGFASVAVFNLVSPWREGDCEFPLTSFCARRGYHGQKGEGEEL